MTRCALSNNANYSKNIIQLELNWNYKLLWRAKSDSFPQICRHSMFRFSFLSYCEHLKEKQPPLWPDMEETRSFNQLSCPSPPFLPPCSLSINWQNGLGSFLLPTHNTAIVYVHTAPPLACKWMVADGLLRGYEGMGGDAQRMPGGRVCLQLASHGNEVPISSGDLCGGWDACSADVPWDCHGTWHAIYPEKGVCIRACFRNSVIMLAF